MFKEKAKIVCIPSKIVANILNPSFIHFYRFLAYKEFPNLKYGLSLPKHGPHITIARTPLEKYDKEKAQKYHNLEVDFFYDPTKIYIGGFAKNFVGFYVKIHSETLEKIRENILLEEPQSTLHLSLFSTKNNSIK